MRGRSPPHGVGCRRDHVQADLSARPAGRPRRPGRQQCRVLRGGHRAAPARPAGDAARGPAGPRGRGRRAERVAAAAAHRGSTGWPPPPPSSPPTGAPASAATCTRSIATEHGVRVVMGDVRGHGLAAVGTVAAVLGSFREAVHDEPELAGVLADWTVPSPGTSRDRARRTPGHRGLRDRPAAGDRPRRRAPRPQLRPPLALSAESARGRAPVTCADPLPPSALSAARRTPAPACGHLLPGETLFLHTDGVEDARDGQGRFFSLPGALVEAVRGRPISPRSCSVRCSPISSATRGTPRTTSPSWCSATTNDLASPSGVRGTARPATNDPQPTTPAPLRCPPRHGVSGRQPGGRRGAGRRTVRGGAGGPAGLLRGISVNRPETLRNSAHTLRIRALRSHPV